MSTSGLTAQLYGAGDLRGTTRALHRAALTALLFGGIILLLQVPIDKISFYLMDESEKTEFFASRYFYIRIWAAPATLLLYVLNGWFLGMQNARYPMIIALVINAVNIFLDFLFVSGLTDNPSVISMAKPFFLWIVIMPLLSYPAFLWDGIYIGLTASRGMRDTMLLSTLIFFFPVWYFSQSQLGNHSLWLALAVFMISRGLTMTIFAKKYIFRGSFITV